MFLSSLLYLEMAHCLHRGKQSFCCCIKTVSNDCNTLAVITRKRLFRIITLKFELDKLNLVLVQNKIFLSLTYFDKFLMTLLQLAV